MKSRFKQLLAILAATLTYGMGSASAELITFDALPGNNLDIFQSYTEDGYTVASTVGIWHVGKNFGDPIPNLFSSNAFSALGYGLEVTKGGAAFTFAGLDISPNQGIETYTFTGWLNGIQQFVFSGQTPQSSFNFYTFANAFSTTVIDDLDILVSAYSNIDNINVNSAAEVSEPGAIALLGIGLLGFATRRKTINTKTA